MTNSTENKIVTMGETTFLGKPFEFLPLSVCIVPIDLERNVVRITQKKLFIVLIV